MLVRKQMDEIRKLYKQIVQSIDGEDTVVEWPGHSISRPVVRKRTKGHSASKQSASKYEEKKSIAISDHKSVTSVLSSRGLSRKKRPSAGNHKSRQGQAIDQGSEELRRKVDDYENGSAIECSHKSETSDIEIRDSRLLAAQLENQPEEEGKKENFEEKSKLEYIRDDGGPRETPCIAGASDNKGECEQYFQEDSAEERETVVENIISKECSTVPKSAGEPQLVCVEVQTENCLDKSDNLSQEVNLEGPDIINEKSSSKDSSSNNVAAKPNSFVQESEANLGVQAPSDLTQEGTSETCGKLGESLSDSCYRQGSDEVYSHKFGKIINNKKNNLDFAQN